MNYEEVEGSTFVDDTLNGTSFEFDPAGLLLFSRDLSLSDLDEPSRVNHQLNSDFILDSPTFNDENKLPLSTLESSPNRVISKTSTEGPTKKRNSAPKQIVQNSSNNQSILAFDSGIFTSKSIDSTRKTRNSRGKRGDLAEWGIAVNQTSTSRPEPRPNPESRSSARPLSSHRSSLKLQLKSGTDTRPTAFPYHPHVKSNPMEIFASPGAVQLVQSPVFPGMTMFPGTSILPPLSSLEFMMPQTPSAANVAGFGDGNSSHVTRLSPPPPIPTVKIEQMEPHEIITDGLFSMMQRAGPGMHLPTYYVAQPPISTSNYFSPTMSGASSSSFEAADDQAAPSDSLPSSPTSILVHDLKKPRSVRPIKLEDDNEDDHGDSSDGSSWNSTNREKYDLDEEEMPQTKRRRSGEMASPDQKRKAHKVIEKRRRENMNRHFEELRELMAMEPAGKARGVCKGDILAAACKYIHEMNDYCKTLYGVNVKLMAERGSQVPAWILNPEAATSRAADIATGRKSNIASRTSSTVSAAAAKKNGATKDAKSKNKRGSAVSRLAFEVADATTTAAVKFPEM